MWKWGPLKAHLWKNKRVCTSEILSRFDMEGDTLYSVKWYRNEQEFYRYVPNDRFERVKTTKVWNNLTSLFYRPKLQIFPQEGIRVQRDKSSKHTVVLFDLRLEASGSYRFVITHVDIELIFWSQILRCEVSAEAPSFRTKHREVSF